MSRMLKTAVVAVAIGLSTGASAQRRPVSSAYMFGIGSRHVTDTYVSPLRYDGVHVSLNGEWSKMMPASPEHLKMTFTADIGGDLLHNPRGNARMYGVDAAAGWGVEYMFRPKAGLALGAGLSADIDGGALYAPRNSNNVVSASFGAHLSLAAEASYSLTLRGRSVVFSDRLRMPLTGAFFSPGYGETYYEIYLGNTGGLVHAGWWGNDLRIDNLLSADVQLGSRTLRLGYRITGRSTAANHLVTNSICHQFVVGVVLGASKSNSR